MKLPGTNGIQAGTFSSVAALSLIVLLGLLLRVYQIDKLSLWSDEGVSTHWALMDAVTMITSIGTRDYPPLYFLLLHFWLKAGPLTDFWARALSALFGVAAIPLMYFLGKILFSRKVGMLAALFLVLSPFHLQYSQELRSYSLLFLLFLSLVILLIKAVRTNQWTFWAGSALVGALMLYTHQIAPIYLFASWSVFILKSEVPFHRIFKRWAVTTLCVAVLFTPWMYTYVERVRLVSETFWVLKPLPLDILKLLVSYTCPMEHVTAGVSDTLGIDAFPFMQNTLVQTVMSTVFTVFSLSGFSVLYFFAVKYGGVSKKREIILLLSLLFVPILIIFSFSVAIRPIFIKRVMFPSLVAIPLLLSAGYHLRGKNLIRLAALVIVLAAYGFSLYGYSRHFQKEDWRGVAEYFAEHHDDGDVLVFSRRAGMETFDWYLHEHEAYSRARKFLLNKNTIKGKTGGELAPAAGAGRLWYIFCPAHNKDKSNQLVTEWLESHFTRTAEVRLTRVTIHLYSKPER